MANAIAITIALKKDPEISQLENEKESESIGSSRRDLDILQSELENRSEKARDLEISQSQLLYDFELGRESRERERERERGLSRCGFKLKVLANRFESFQENPTQPNTCGKWTA